MTAPESQNSASQINPLHSEKQEMYGKSSEANMNKD